MISKYKYKFVKDWEDLKTLVKYCKQTGYASVDFETTGAPATYPGAKPTILGVSFQPGGSWIIPLAHKDSPFINQYEKVLKYFGKHVIEDPNIIKIAHNAKFEMNWFRKYGISIVGRIFDTMLAKYLLDEERPHGLKELVARFIPEYAGYDLPGQPSSKAPKERIIEYWSNVPLIELSKYCALDADLTFRLWIFFERRLIDNGFYPLFRNMLMMASRVLEEAEYEGMTIDVNYLKGLVDSYDIKIKECEIDLRNIPTILSYEKSRLRSIKKNMIHELKLEIKNLKETGGSSRMIKTREEKISKYIVGDYTTKKEQDAVSQLNFGSPKQMIDLLFESDAGFKFNIVKYTEDKKTKKFSDTPSTDEEVLLELKQYDETGFIDKLLELRGLTKLNSTYVIGMWERLTSKNTIHGSFLLHGTVTGRLSSRNPNFQNIPRDTTASDIKKMFIPPKGKLLLQLDYSQAELRVLADAAGEETMIHWFNTGRDIHLASACDKYKEDYDEILVIYSNEEHPEFKKWKMCRKQAKTLNFGIVYGQTAKKLAENLSTPDHKVSEIEAQEFLDDFNERFPKIAEFIKSQHRKVKKHGYVINLFGRKRRLPNVYSDNWGKKAEALRQSVNAPIQGAASDFALFSSIIIREYIHRGLLPRSLVQIGTVHDSLLFHIDPCDIHKVIPTLFKICNNPETKEWFNFEVKGVEMKVDFEIGTNWGTLKNYHPEELYESLAA